MAVDLDFPWDLLVDDRGGQPVLVVEVATNLNSSPEWATEFRYNILSGSYLAQPPIGRAVMLRETLLSPPKNNISSQSKFIQSYDFRRKLYFLMVFPDQFYLWTKTDFPSHGRQPDYIIDAVPILQPYLERAGVSADQISEQSLEIIVAAWLGEIIHSSKLPQEMQESQPWLIQSGLYGAIAGGQVRYRVAA